MSTDSGWMSFFRAPSEQARIYILLRNPWTIWFNKVVSSSGSSNPFHCLINLFSQQIVTLSTFHLQTSQLMTFPLLESFNPLSLPAFRSILKPLRTINGNFRCKIVHILTLGRRQSKYYYKKHQHIEPEHHPVAHVRNI